MLERLAHSPHPGTMDTIELIRSALAGRYDLEREIGRGGMATVFLARDVKLQRRVALKVLNPDLGALVGAQRFVREIDITANLQHPNVLPLFDSGEAAGLLFYVMPYVDGESLRARLDRDRQLPIDDAVRIAVAVAHALEYAHGQGVVHRDLKPENILLQSGEPLVADFGIAIAVSNAGGERITATGISLGTPQYMSPEQAAADRVLDARTDIYSLGAVLYEALTGEPPHMGNTAQSIIARVLTEKPRSILAARPHVPEHVVAAVDRAMEKVPADRFASAKEMADALSRPTTRAAAVYIRSRRWRAPFIAAGTIGAAVLAGFLAYQATGSGAQVRSVAVLPFADLTGDSAHAYLAEGLYGALVGELTQISTLRVIPRASLLHVDTTGKRRSDIARELGVDALIEAKVFRAGDTVRVNVELIRLQPESYLWAETYHRELRDVMALHRDLAHAIAAEVQARLTPREAERLARPKSMNAAAYDAWLRGSVHASRRRGEDLSECVRYGEQATALDPQFAEAHQLLADCYNLMVFVNAVPPTEMFAKAKSAARRAIALDPGLARAHASLAYTLAVHDWDWVGAESSYRQALALNPADDAAHGDLGWLLSWLGRFDEAVVHARRAEELNPLSPQAALRFGMVLHLARRHEEALAQAKRATQLDPQFMFAYARMYAAYLALGRLSEAVAAAERAAELAGPGDLRRRASLAQAYASVGRADEARSMLKELLAREDTYVPPTAIATIYLGLGERERALDWLERGFEGRDGDMVVLRSLPFWDPLRGEPRFQAIIRGMRFPES